MSGYEMLVFRVRITSQTGGHTISESDVCDGNEGTVKARLGCRVDMFSGMLDADCDHGDHHGSKNADESYLKLLALSSQHKLERG